MNINTLSIFISFVWSCSFIMYDIIILSCMLMLLILYTHMLNWLFIFKIITHSLIYIVNYKQQISRCKGCWWRWFTLWGDFWLQHNVNPISINIQYNGTSITNCETLITIIEPVEAILCKKRRKNVQLLIIFSDLTNGGNRGQLYFT